MYEVVAVLFTAGDQVPVIPFVEVVGRAGIAAPTQNGPTGVNVGVIFGFTVTVMVVGVAHCPAAGVKVYVVVAVLFTAGDQVPMIPFVEVVGRAGMAAPAQKGPTGLNAGAITGFTVTLVVETEDVQPFTVALTV